MGQHQVVTKTNGDKPSIKHRQEHISKDFFLDHFFI